MILHGSILSTSNSCGGALPNKETRIRCLLGTCVSIRASTLRPCSSRSMDLAFFPFFLLCFILFSCYPFILFFKASRFRIDYRKRLVKIWDTARWSLERGRSHVNRFDNKCTWSLYLVIIINALKHLLNFKVIPDCHSFYIFLLCCSLTTYFFFF